MISKIAVTLVFSIAMLAACGGGTGDGGSGNLSLSGSLDPNFGRDGIALIAPNSSFDNLFWVATDTEGSVYLAGSTLRDVAYQSNFYILKLDQKGNPVNDFGMSGKVVVDVDGLNITGRTMLALDRAGNVYVAGTAIAAPATPDSGLQPQVTIVILKLDSKGKFVPTFGAEGKLVIDLNGNYSKSLAALLLDGADNVYAVGNAFKFEAVNGERISRSSIVVSKFDQNGNLIRGFGVDGEAILNTVADESSSTASLDSRGNLYIASSFQNNTGPSNSVTSVGLTAIKLDNTGKLDKGFGVEGRASIAVDGAGVSIARMNAIASDSQGNVYMGGVTNYSGGTLVKFDSHGILEKRFGDGGNVLVHFDSTTYGVTTMAIDDSDNIIVGGSAAGKDDNQGICPDDFAVAKFDSLGHLAVNFASGMMTFDLGRKDTDIVRAMTLDGHGHVYVAGVTAKQTCQIKPSLGSAVSLAVARVFL